MSQDQAVKSLYDNIRDLQKGAEQLKVENGGLKDRNGSLQAQLDRLLAENAHLKRKRSMSHASRTSVSKSSVSRRSSCTQDHDDDPDFDGKEASLCQRSLQADTSCTSSLPELDDSLCSATDATVDPPDIPNGLDLGLEDEGMRTFYDDFDTEAPDNLLSPSVTQANYFSAFDNVQGYGLDRPASIGASEQLSPAGAQHLSQMPSSELPSFTLQTDPNSSLTNRTSLGGSGIGSVAGGKAGFGGHLFDPFEPVKRRKSAS